MKIFWYPPLFNSALVPGIKNDQSLMVNNGMKILRHPFNVCYDCDTVINKSLCFKPALLRKPIDFTTVINFYHPLIFAHHSKRPSFSRTPSARSNCCAGQVRENKRGVNLMEMRLNSCTTMSSSQLDSIALFSFYSELSEFTSQKEKIQRRKIERRSRRTRLTLTLS